MIDHNTPITDIVNLPFITYWVIIYFINISNTLVFIILSNINNNIIYYQNT